MVFELVKALGARGLAQREAIPFGLSLVIAELFYKFHSFTLEVAGFLVTWFVLDALWANMYRAFGKRA